MLNALLKSIKKKVFSCALTVAYEGMALGTLGNMPLQVETKNEVAEYALLINGDYRSFHHEANISRALGKLRDIGYDKNNIICLAGEDTRENKLSNHNHKPATAESLEEAVSYLQEHVDDNDILLVYTTGHGARKDDESYLQLGDAAISAEEFAKALNKIDFGRLILVADQCYSGGFVDKIEDLEGNIVAMSDTDETHTTYCQPFAIGFWSAIGNDQYGTNWDGSVSVAEAYSEGMKRAKIELTTYPEFGTDGVFSVKGELESSSLRLIQ